MGTSSSKSFSPNKGQTTPAPNVSKSQSKKMADNDYVEAVVCNETDLKDNEMKTFELADAGRVLLVKQNGEFSALGTKCSHYGAPLTGAALSNGRLRCQWHGACFNIKTGDIEDFPGLDSLPCYQVTVQKDGGVRVRAKKSDLEANKRVKKIVLSKSVCDSATVVIAGGGPSAATCVETLRQQGFEGRIVLIAKENYLPYDRIKLSKAGMANEPLKLQFRNEEFYEDSKIEVLKGTEVVGVDTENKKVNLSDGNTIDYTALYLATGSKPRLPNIPGNDLKNVYTLRNVEDSAAITDALGSEKDKEVVVLGLSFIGLEAAAASVDYAKKVTVVGTATCPLETVFGKELGVGLLKLFESKGINFAFQNSITSCNGEDGVLKSVQLTNGTILPADVLIIGVGTTFNTEFLKESGIQLQPDGSVTVNDRLQTNISSVFAGGDIAYAPVFSYRNKPAAIGHIGLAQYHGKVAALNILNKDVPLRTVPYFWTMMFGKSIRYSGYGKYSEVIVDGDLAELKFVMFFLDETERVIAVASCMRDPVVSQFAEYTSQGKFLYKKDLSEDKFAWINSIS